MRKTIIRIDTSTIRKNPDAFATTTNVVMGQEVSVKFTGDIPKEFTDDVFFPTTWDDDKNVRGELLDMPSDEVIKSVRSQVSNFVIERKINRTTTRHAPEPEYLFKYKEKSIKCGSCKKLVKVSEIDSDCDDDTGDSWDVCPKCGEPNSFGIIEYEKFSFKTLRVKSESHGKNSKSK